MFYSLTAVIYHLVERRKMFVLAVLTNVAQQWGFLSASTEQIDFQLGLLLFLNSRQQSTPLLPVPIVGPPPRTSRVHG